MHTMFTMRGSKRERERGVKLIIVLYVPTLYGTVQWSRLYGKDEGPIDY